ncbi:MAG: DUF2497 domain-containing protein, partial [Hyphomicrobiales bacterium]|nr:DUF2497 domain-containing protein [Hyphomicrobiales bacterium]
PLRASEGRRPYVANPNDDFEQWLSETARRARANQSIVEPGRDSGPKKAVSPAAVNEPPAMTAAPRWAEGWDEPAAHAKQAGEGQEDPPENDDAHWREARAPAAAGAGESVVAFEAPRVAQKDASPTADEGFAQSSETLEVQTEPSHSVQQRCDDDYAHAYEDAEPAEAEDDREEADLLDIPVGAAAEQPGIMSNSTSTSVSSSFQALAQTMVLQNSDMIEEAIRRMLKPMLRQWLDDNLPSLVERLVRAEIERVARGGP